MSQSYYLHTPTDWSAPEVDAIKAQFEKLGFRESIDAAIGEGSGGTGFETVIEVLLTNPITYNLISAVIYDFAKFLWKKPPKDKRLPVDVSAGLDSYRLVVHVRNVELNTIIGLDLKSDIKDIEIAVTTKLAEKLQDKPGRLYQNGSDWDVY